MTFSYRIDSPLGGIILRSDGVNLTAATFTNAADELPHTAPDATPDAAPEILTDAAIQLSEYFDGTRTEFDLPLAPAGTEFQRCVWNELRLIPWGARISYGELARRIGKPDAVRAVGAANGRNPIAIIIPCHRVVGADGSLTGYAAGIDRKHRLLELESDELTLFG